MALYIFDIQRKSCVHQFESELSIIPITSQESIQLLTKDLIDTLLSEKKELQEALHILFAKQLLKKSKCQILKP